MSFGNLARAFKYQSLRCMKGGKVGTAASIVGQVDRETCLSTCQTFLGLFQIPCGFWCQSCKPSRLISCIKGLRSLY